MPLHQTRYASCSLPGHAILRRLLLLLIALLSPSASGAVCDTYVTKIGVIHVGLGQDWGLFGAIITFFGRKAPL